MIRYSSEARQIAVRYIQLPALRRSSPSVVSGGPIPREQLLQFHATVHQTVLDAQYQEPQNRRRRQPPESPPHVLQQRWTNGGGLLLVPAVGALTTIEEQFECVGSKH